MMGVLIVSQIFSWLVILGLAVALLALARQVGVLHMRVAPAGALTPAKGPVAGEISPKLDVVTMDGTSLTIGALLEKGHRQLLLFVSPHCPICKELIPVAQSFAKREDLDILFMGDDAPADIQGMMAKMAIDGRSFVNSPAAGRAFHIDKLPHAVLIGEDGNLLSKGLVNSREHLESLVTAHEMGVVSVQDYLASLNPKSPDPISRRGSHEKISIDRIGEKLVRRLAGHTSRRGLLSRLGLALAAAPVFPVLPVGRAQAQGKAATGAMRARTHFHHERPDQGRHQVRLLALLRRGRQSLRLLRRRHAYLPGGRSVLHAPGSAPASIPMTTRPI